MRQAERLGGEVEPPRRRKWCAPGRDCGVFPGNYCLKEYEKALADLGTDPPIDPEHFSYWWRLRIDSLDNLGNFEAALEMLRSPPEGFDPIWCELKKGRILVARGDLQGAIDVLETPSSEWN
jgi:tetratricopeptide (TPR) repeat protein